MQLCRAATLPSVKQPDYAFINFTPQIMEKVPPTSAGVFFLGGGRKRKRVPTRVDNLIHLDGHRELDDHQSSMTIETSSKTTVTRLVIIEH